MKKRILVIAIIAIANSFFLATPAHAERYFAGTMKGGFPPNVVLNHQMCAVSFNGFETSTIGTVVFTTELNGCPAIYAYGFTPDGKVAVSILYEGQRAYILSKSPARQLQSEVEGGYNAAPSATSYAPAAPTPKKSLWKKIQRSTRKVTPYAAAFAAGYVVAKNSGGRDDHYDRNHRGDDRRDRRDDRWDERDNRNHHQRAPGSLSVCLSDCMYRYNDGNYCHRECN